MATDAVNIGEDAEMAECDGDKVVTMMDVLQEQQDFEEDANAVLGASDDKNCTYSKGYIKRQALYACLTCCTEAKTDPTKRAGVCLACSLNCHENHELIELYTKRNFRCDCGNPKFNSHPCQFTSDKTDINEENIYNQNFSGLYCTCQRPYPDPESSIEDDMIQCIICEDWLHSSHLETVVPANDQYAEMICKSCMEKNEFLHDYSVFAVNAEVRDGLEIDVITVNGHAKSADKKLCNGDVENEKLVNGTYENKTEIDGANVSMVNGDVEMNDDKQNRKDKVTDGSESKEESIAPETKQDDSNNIESTVSNAEENEKPDNEVDSEKLDNKEDSEKLDNKEDSEKLDNKEDCEKLDNKDSEKLDSNEDSEKLDNKEDGKMDLDAESKDADQEEQSMETTDTNESDKNNDAPTLDDSNIEKENETSKDMEAQSEDKLDAAEITSEGGLDQNNETSTNDPTVDDKTDDKMDGTNTEPEKIGEAVKEQSDTQKQNVEKFTVDESGDGDKLHESDRTEQQLMDDLSVLTADTLPSEEKTDKATEEKPAEQPDDNKKIEDFQTNNEELTKETTTEIGDSSEKKPVSETEKNTDNIEVPDTSQSKPTEKWLYNTESVMDAIDELLQTTSEAKESETTEENKESISEPTESKENVESKETIDVEMSASENKLDNEVSEKTDDTTETNDKTSTSNDTEDVEMSDDGTQNASPVSESKVDDDPTVDSESKDANDAEASDSISKTEVSVNEYEANKESQKDVDEKSEVIDIVKERISQENKTEHDLRKSIDESDSLTNKSELSTDDNKETNVTEITKEHKRKLSTDRTEDISSKKTKLECTRPREVKRVHKGATFWPSNFRQKLCTCGECLSMYKDLKVLFLTDLEDTVFAYESLGKENVAGGASQYEKGMQALSSLDRIQQINALTEYNKMRDKLLDFLKSFKDRKEVVKEEDIKAFFAGMKPRREPDGVYFCR